MDADKIRCLNCLADENDGNISLEIESGDTSAAIYYDENGVLVKKTITNSEEKATELKENTPPEIPKKEARIKK